MSTPALRLLSVTEGHGLGPWVLCATPWPFSLRILPHYVILATSCCGQRVVVSPEPHCRCGAEVTRPAAALLARFEGLECWAEKPLLFLETAIGEFEDPLSTALLAHEVAEDVATILAWLNELRSPHLTA